MPASRAERLALAAVVLGAVTIGLAPILVRLSPVGPTATAFYRFLFAIPLYAALAAVVPAGGPARGTSRPRTVRDFLLISATGAYLAADMGVWHYSIRLTTVANATLLANVAPVFVVLGGWLLFGARVTRTYLLGLAGALVGIFLLSRASLSLSPSHFVGDLLGILTAVFYAAYQLSVERHRRRFATITIMLGAMPAAAVLMLAAALVTGESLLPGSARGWAVLVALAAGPQVVGQGLIAWSLRHLPVAFASVSLLVQPITAAAVAWLLLHEPVGQSQALGAIVALAGIALARHGMRR